ncbi:MAG: MFS transporter [Firmicutes bacterium]|nr:MFS transporter [Bacillota bacterium]
MKFSDPEEAVSLTAEIRATERNSWKNWAYFYGSVFFFMANLFAVIATFPAYSLSIGSTPFQSGLQNTVFGLSAVIFRLVLGPVMDQKGAKPLMLFGAFTFATTPLIVMLGSTYWLLLFARIYQALGLAVFLPGISTMVAELAPAKRLGTYLGSLRIFFNLGLLVGPATAIFLIDNYGYNSWFAVSAIVGALSLLLLASVKPGERTITVTAMIGSLKNYAEALQVKVLYPIIVGIALLSTIYSAIISFTALHIKEPAAGATAAHFFMIFGVAGIIGALSAGALSDRVDRSRIAWPLMFFLGLGTILFAFIDLHPALVIICAIILGISTQGSSLVFAAWLLDLAKPGLRATTVSIQENTIDIFFAFGALFFGLAAQGPGLSSAFLTVGLIIIFSIMPLGLITKKLSAF